MIFFGIHKYSKGLYIKKNDKKFTLYGTFFNDKDFFFAFFFVALIIGSLLTSKSQFEMEWVMIIAIIIIASLRIFGGLLKTEMLILVIVTAFILVGTSLVQLEMYYSILIGIAVAFFFILIYIVRLREYFTDSTMVLEFDNEKREFHCGDYSVNFDDIDRLQLASWQSRTEIKKSTRRKRTNGILLYTKDDTRYALLSQKYNTKLKAKYWKDLLYSLEIIFNDVLEKEIPCNKSVKKTKCPINLE